MQVPDSWRPLSPADEAVVAEFARELERAPDPRPTDAQLEQLRAQLEVLPSSAAKILATRLLSELRLERGRRLGQGGG